MNELLNAVAALTLEQLFDQNVGLEQTLANGSILFDDYEVDVQSLSPSQQEAIANALVAMKPVQKSSSKEVIAYNTLNQREKLALIKANTLEGKAANEKLKAVYEMCYVKLGNISNLPMEAKRGSKTGDYQTKKGEGYLVLEDVIKKNAEAEAFDDDALLAIKREQKLSETQFAYLQDLKESGATMARVQINVESRKNGGVRRYRLEDLLNSLTSGTGKFENEQLQKEAEAWFKSKAVGQGDEKRLIVTLPEAESDTEARFYPFKMVELGAINSVTERFAIRESARIAKSTEADRTSIMSTNAKIAANTLSQFGNIAGFDVNKAFETIWSSMNK